MASGTTSLASLMLRQLRAVPPRSSPLGLGLALQRIAPVARAPRQPTFVPITIRAAHSIPRPPPRQPAAPKSDNESPEGASPKSWSENAPVSEGERPQIKNPAYYQLSFTCVPCGHRSHHNISKQGYHHGSTLITCPSCRNRHIISDHLKIFGDRQITVEDLMREQGKLVKRGSLGEDGDIEFWPEESYEDPAAPTGGKEEDF